MRIAGEVYKDEIKTLNPRQESDNARIFEVMTDYPAMAHVFLNEMIIEESSRDRAVDPDKARGLGGLRESVGLRQCCGHAVHSHRADKLLEVRRFSDRALGDNPDTVLNIA